MKENLNSFLTKFDDIEKINFQKDEDFIFQFNSLLIETKEDFIDFIINNEDLEPDFRREAFKFGIANDCINFLIGNAKSNASLLALGKDEPKFVKNSVLELLDLITPTSQDSYEIIKEKTFKSHIITELLYESSELEIKNLIQSLLEDKQISLIKSLAISLLNFNVSFDKDDNEIVSIAPQPQNYNMLKNIVKSYMDTLPKIEDLNKIFSLDNNKEKDRMASFIIGGMSLINGKNFPETKAEQLLFLLDTKNNGINDERTSKSLEILYDHSFKIQHNSSNLFISKIRKPGTSNIENLKNKANQLNPMDHHNTNDFTSLLVFDFEKLSEFYKKFTSADPNPPSKDPNALIASFINFIKEILSKLGIEVSNTSASKLPHKQNTSFAELVLDSRKLNNEIEK